MDNDLQGYWCLVCQRFIERIEIHGVGFIVHDDVEHPVDMTYNEQSNPQ